MSTLSVVSLILLAIYTAVLLYLGFVAGKRTKTMADFAVAGGNIGGVLTGLAVFASFCSAASYLGIPALLYNQGWSAFWLWIGPALGWVFGVLVLGLRTRVFGRALGSLTISQFLGDRYQSRGLVALLGCVTAVLMVPIMIGQLKGSGLVFQYITGLSYEAGVLISAGVVFLYMVVGGMYADVYTDAFQALIMMLMTVLLVPIGLNLVGGFGGLNQTLAAQNPVLVAPFNPSFFTPFVATMTVLYWTMAVFTAQPHGTNKFLSIRSVKDLRAFVIVGTIGYTIFASNVSLAGLFARAVNPNLPQADTSTLWLLANHFPVWVAATILVAILAATMSTVDGILHVVGLSVSNDIYRRFWVPLRGRDPEAPEVDRIALRLSRIMLFVFTVLPTYFALASPPKFLLLLIYVGIGGILSATFAPYVVGLYWRGATRSGAIAALVVGLASFLVTLLGFSQTAIVAGPIAVAASVVTIYVVSKWTPGVPSPAFVAELFSLLK
jgi:sodium/proline symporter